MKSKKFNIHIEYDNVKEDVQCESVSEVCDFLGIGKSQYIGIRSGRTKFQRDYNKHLASCSISKLKIQPIERKKRKKINIDEIMNKVKELDITSQI